MSLMNFVSRLCRLSGFEIRYTRLRILRFSFSMCGRDDLNLILKNEGVKEELIHRSLIDRVSGCKCE